MRGSLGRDGLAPPPTRRSTLSDRLYVEALTGSSAHAEIDPAIAL